MVVYKREGTELRIVTDADSPFAVVKVTYFPRQTNLVTRAYVYLSDSLMILREIVGEGEHTQDELDKVNAALKLSLDYSTYDMAVQTARGAVALARERVAEVEAGADMQRIKVEKNKLAIAQMNLLRLEQNRLAIKKALFEAMNDPMFEATLSAWRTYIIQNQMERQSLELGDVRAEQETLMEENALNSPILCKYCSGPCIGCRKR